MTEQEKVSIDAIRAIPLNQERTFYVGIGGGIERARGLCAHYRNKEGRLLGLEIRTSANQEEGKITITKTKKQP